MSIDFTGTRRCNYGRKYTNAIAARIHPITALKLTRIGNSVGVVLPKDILSRLRLEAGDSVYLNESPEGYRLSAYDESFDRQMAVAERVMRENRDVLRLLAK